MKTKVMIAVGVTVALICGCSGKPGGGDRFELKDDNATVAQGQSVTISVLSNDSFYPHANEHGTYIVLKEITQAPTKGVAVINNGNGTVTYSANVGASGDDTFVYSAYATGQKEQQSGGTREFNTTAKEATVTIHITEVANEKPVSNSMGVEIDCDVAAQPSVEIELTGSDPEGEVLTYEIVSHPAHGTLSSLNGNQVTYSSSMICNNNQDVFTFRVSDGVQFSQEANVTILPVGI